VGVLPTVFGIVGLCLCWLPSMGWLGVLAGTVACGIAVPCIVYWYERPGYTGWAIAGMVYGSFSAALGIAYQIKHSAGQLDMLYYSMPMEIVAGVVLGSIVIAAVSIWIARKRPLLVWLLVTYIVIIASIVTVSSAWVTADRANNNIVGCNTKEMP
jgi:hypothetical protein